MEKIINAQKLDYMARCLRQVSAFHTTFNHPIGIEKIGVMDNMNLTQLRHDLIKEETLELSQAMIENNAMGVIDAICDLQYVLSGAIIVHGMSTHFLDYIKVAEESREPTINEYNKSLYLLVDKIQQHNSNYRNSERLPNSGEAYDAALYCLAEIQILLFEFTNHIWVNTEQLIQCFQLVQDSNMSKAFTAGQWKELVMTMKHYEIEQNIKQYKVELLADGGYVLKRLDDKVLKNVSYKPVNHGDFDRITSGMRMAWKLG